MSSTYDTIEEARRNIRSRIICSSLEFNSKVNKIFPNEKIVIDFAEYISHYLTEYIKDAYRVLDVVLFGYSINEIREAINFAKQYGWRKETK